jgi:hypothetical protein
MRLPSARRATYRPVTDAVSDVTVTSWVKVVFSVVTTTIFVLVSVITLQGALNQPGFAPNEAVTWLLVTFSTAIITFIAAQLGVTVASPGRSLNTRLRYALTAESEETAGPSSTVTVASIVLLLNVLAITVVGLCFIWLWADPGQIAVKEGADPLKEAPEYIKTHAQAFAALIVAGFGGLLVGAAKPSEQNT